MAPHPLSWPWPQQQGRGVRTAGYRQLADELRSMIITGWWKPAMRLPSEREMSQGTGLCSNTIKRALSELENEGLIYKRQGVGSFVCSQISKEHYRYYHLIEHFTAPPVQLEVNQIECVLTHMPSDIAEYFAEAEGSLPISAYRIERSFLMAQKPGIWSVSWLLASLFPGLEGRLEGGHNGKPLYMVLENEYNVPSLNRKELLFVREPPKHVAKILNVPVDKALLCSEFIGYTYCDRPFEFRTTFLVTDTHKMLRNC